MYSPKALFHQKANQIICTVFYLILHPTLIVMLPILNFSKFLDVLSTTLQVKGFMYSPKVLFHQKANQIICTVLHLILHPTLIEMLPILNLFKFLDVFSTTIQVKGSMYTLSSLTLESIAARTARAHASYSAMLLVQSNPSLAVKGTH